MQSKAQKKPRIGRKDWIEAGLWLLAEEGVAAITIDRLCRELAVTKGSFYWHFQGRQDFLQAMADYWANVDILLDELRNSQLGDWEQVNEMVRRVGSLGYGRIDKAMRIWAGESSGTAAAVSKTDKQILHFIAEKLRDMGLAKTQARDVAELIVSSGIGLASIDPLPSKAKQARLEKLWLQLIDSL